MNADAEFRENVKCCNRRLVTQRPSLLEFAVMLDCSQGHLLIKSCVSDATHKDRKF